MLTIATRLLLLGSGPAPLVAAKTAAGRGLPCVLVGHELVDDVEPVTLDEEALDVLRPNGVLDVLRPYAAAQEPFAIAPLHFEQTLKHHCVADMLVTVYDRMWFELDGDSDEAADADGPIAGSLTDGSSRWPVTTDAVFDPGLTVSGLGPAAGASSDSIPVDLNTAILRGARFAEALAGGR